MGGSFLFFKIQIFFFNNLMNTRGINPQKGGEKVLHFIKVVLKIQILNFPKQEEFRLKGGNISRIAHVVLHTIAQRQRADFREHTCVKPFTRKARTTPFNYFASLSNPGVNWSALQSQVSW